MTRLTGTPRFAASARRFAAAVTVIALSSACQYATTVPAKTGTQARIAPGEAFEPTNSSLRIVFEKVTNDSRCPTDGMCVWAGNAAVVIVVSGTDGRFAATSYTINTTTDLREVYVASYRIRLEQLDPAPVSGSPTAQSAYRATISATYVIID